MRNKRKPLRLNDIKNLYLDTCYRFILCGIVFACGGLPFFIIHFIEDDGDLFLLVVGMIFVVAGCIFVGLSIYAGRGSKNITRGEFWIITDYVLSVHAHTERYDDTYKIDHYEDLWT